MDALRQYILRILCAGILCGIVKTLTGSKSAAGLHSSVLCGIFMALTVVSPLVRLDLEGWFSSLEAMAPSSQAVIARGEELAAGELSAIISRQCRAYILDKAGAMSLEVDAHVEVSRDPVPVPVSVTVTGALSPYGRQQLSRMLTRDLGIGEEAQFWVE